MSVPFCIRTSNEQVSIPVVPYTHQQLVLSLLDFGPSRRSVMTPSCFIICNSLMPSGFDYLCIWIFAICISLLLWCLFSSLPIFWLDCFLLLHLNILLTIIGKILYRYVFWRNFLSVACFFILLTVFFFRAEVFIFKMFNVTVVFFLHHAFDAVPKNYCQTQGHRDFLLYFLLKFYNFVFYN